jgi:hypothetical protein
MILHSDVHVRFPKLRGVNDTVHTVPFGMASLDLRRSIVNSLYSDFLHCEIIQRKLRST